MTQKFFTIVRDSYGTTLADDSIPAVWVRSLFHRLVHGRLLKSRDNRTFDVLDEPVCIGHYVMLYGPKRSKSKTQVEFHVSPMTEERGATVLVTVHDGNYWSKLWTQHARCTLHADCLAHEGLSLECSRLAIEKLADEVMVRMNAGR